MSYSTPASVLSRLLSHRAGTLACCFGVVGSLVWWAVQPPDEAELTLPEERPAAIEAENARSIVVREGGHKLWEFAAQHIAIRPEASRTTVENVYRGTLFRQGQPIWQLKAKRVSLNQVTKDVDAGGKVTANGPNGLRIETTRAVWKDRAKRLICPNPVVATMRGFTVQTESAVYDLTKDELRCNAIVTVTSKYGTMRSPSAVAHPKRRVVEFRGGIDMAIDPSQLDLPTPSQRGTAR
jgi:LPS export ABC transporter protein LptC